MYGIAEDFFIKIYALALSQNIFMYRTYIDIIYIDIVILCNVFKIKFAVYFATI